MADVTGLVLVDKPKGRSSFAVLRGLRPALGRKLGHAGTLDPFATGMQRAAITVRCSKGTYIRQLAADLGTATGAGAYCLELRRTHVGGFDVADSGAPDEIAADPLGRWYRAPADALPHLPSRT